MIVCLCLFLYHTTPLLGHQFVGAQNYPHLGVSLHPEAAGGIRGEAGRRCNHPPAAHDQGLPHEAGPGLHLQRRHVPLRRPHAVCHTGQRMRIFTPRSHNVCPSVYASQSVLMFQLSGFISQSLIFLADILYLFSFLLWERGQFTGPIPLNSRTCELPSLLAV